MVLTEDFRILAGLQESKTIENPLPKIIKEEQEQILREQQRIENEKKTVISHFNLFEEKMFKYNNMIQKVMKLFDESNKKEFVDGLFESKYRNLQRFADIVINDSLSTMMIYLEKNYYDIKDELEKIEFLIENDNVINSEDFFVSNTIFSHDPNHNFNIRVYKNKNLDEKVSNEILYGSQIISINNNMSLIKESGIKYYTPLTLEQLKELEKKGYLI